MIQCDDDGADELAHAWLDGTRSAETSTSKIYMVRWVVVVIKIFMLPP